MKKILVGTSKGLVVFVQEKEKWEVQKVHFLGMPVSMIFVDERHGTWWLGLSHRHWGQKLHFSKNEGKTWQAVPTPKYPRGLEIKAGKPTILKKIWCMQGGGFDRPNELWLGTEPGDLFHSKDYGQSFQLVEGLWNHPSRKNSSMWFGAGRDFPFLHSIVIHPTNSNHLYVAISCAGVFESKDGGQNWQAKNEGLVAAYLPNPHVEIGHDPHLILACKKHPEVLWQQNHCGIFRSTNGGQYWENVTDKNKLADYGFALAIDHHNPKKAWVIPATSDEMRVAQDLALCVCRTEDGGKTWQALRNGLPQQHCFDIVFRHALVNNGDNLVFGTTTGNLYFSENGGDNWKCLSGNLARIDCVSFA